MVKLSHTTLIRLSNGGRTLAQSNAAKTLITKEEEDVVINYTLLQTNVTKHGITEERTWGVNEIGCQPSGGVQERVMGAKRKGPMYQQRNGNRETITVLVTICANGTATPPAIIFKGSAYQALWKQNNPANAS